MFNADSVIAARIKMIRNSFMEAMHEKALIHPELRLERTLKNKANTPREYSTGFILRFIASHILRLLVHIVIRKQRKANEII